MTDQSQTAVYRLADRYVEQLAELDPLFATSAGIPGHDDRYPDLSPDGLEARNALDRQTRAELIAAPIETHRDRVAADFLRERLETQIDLHEAGESLRQLRIIGSPAGAVRQAYDLMPRETVEDWETIAARMERIPEALDGVRETLEAGRRRGLMAARRQATEHAKQCATWGGEGVETPFLVGFVEQAAGIVGDPLLQQLKEHATAGTAAFADFARYLREEYAPSAPEQDAVGPDRYGLLSRVSLGARIDLEETYRWGWHELHRIEAEMDLTAQRIIPGGTVEEAEELLESDPARAIEGVEEFRRWTQDLQDRTIAELDGKHFGIPEPVRRIEAMIAPPGTAAAMYYTRPSEDFSRPGRTWYPTLGKTRFPLWGEVSIAYHEGVPGHHLQGGILVYLKDELSRFQRTSFLSAYGEGWALYAERLMDELGYLENPDYRLGMLRAHVMRAVRVVVDIGMHLQLEIPSDDRFHPGERWTPELGQQFVDERSHFPRDFMASEIVRYLGWPGQAISYKVGERAWLEGREAARARKGDAFDLKEFHSYALGLGPLGLDQLRAEFQRF